MRPYGFGDFDPLLPIVMPGYAGLAFFHVDDRRKIAFFEASDVIFFATLFSPTAGLSRD
jgi:hypothetical protein